MEMGVFHMMAPRVNVIRLERKVTSLTTCGGRAADVGDAPLVGVMWMWRREGMAMCGGLDVKRSKRNVRSRDESAVVRAQCGVERRWQVEKGGKI